MADDFRWRAHVSSDPYQIGPSLWLYRKSSDGTIQVIEPLTLRTVPKGDEPPSGATFSPEWDNNAMLRALFDAAWDAGMRPDGWNDTRESVTAVKAHLEDMRKLAFDGHQVLIEAARAPRMRAPSELFDQLRPKVKKP